MPIEETNGFTSLSDFKSKFSNMFAGPTFSSTFSNLDARLRKKIMIAVSIVNDCKE